MSKEKNKVLVKDALEKIDKKDARIKRLEEENLTKHTKLGQTQTKLAELKSQLESKKEEIKKLHKLAVSLSWLGMLEIRFTRQGNFRLC